MTYVRLALAIVALATIGAVEAGAADLKTYTKNKNFEDLTAAEHTAAKATALKSTISTITACADPGNMPLSNNKAEGFQNKIIEVLARSMGGTVNFFWRPYLERGLTRETFDNHECDILLEMPANSASILTTNPIYRSTYVLAYRNDKGLDIHSLDDPKLKELKIGVFQHSGAREALVRRGLSDNLSIHAVSHDADLEPERQPWRQVQQVVDGELDVAAVWGPFAGWLKTMKGAPLTIEPINLMEDQIPLEFELAIGMPKTHVVLKYMLDNALEKNRDEIAAILKSYGVPLVACARCTVDGDIPTHGTYFDKLRGLSNVEDRFLKQAATIRPTDKATPDQVVDTPRLDAWLKEGADPTAELWNAVTANDADRVTYLISKGAQLGKPDPQGATPLHIAARNRNSVLVELLADHGADPNVRDQDGFTPLLYAINRNHVPTIDMLVKKGADTELPTTGGITPLVWAIGDGKYYAAKALIDAGAKVDARSGAEGVTALMTIATQLTAPSRAELVMLGPPPLELAKLLIDKGADVNATSKDGVTALMVAAGHNNAPMIGLLAASGAHIEAKSAAGLTALDIAKEAGNDTASGALALLARPVEGPPLPAGAN